MEKNTLKGNIKVLSYIAAFIFMVGIHMAMDKMGNTKEPVENKKAEEFSVRSDNYSTNADSLSNDSLFVSQDNKMKDNLITTKVCLVN